jgi:hypothetical protein
VRKRKKQNKSLWQNRDAQVAGLFIVGVGLAMLGFYIMILCPMIAEVNNAQNSLTVQGVPLSTAKVETMTWLQMAFNALPWVIPVILFVWAIMNSLAERNTVNY